MSVLCRLRFSFKVCVAYGGLPRWNSTCWDIRY